MEEDKVLCEIKDQIAFITLNKPDRLNSVCPAVWAGLVHAADKILQDRNVRVAILKAAGDRAFCAGLDLKEATSITADPLKGLAGSQLYNHYYETVTRLQKMFQRIEELPVPVIAAIHGYCIGAGVELSLCCDIRIGTDDAIFTVPEVQLGMTPDMGCTQRLFRVVGVSKAKQIIYTAARFSAQEAHRIGLIDEIVPRAKLMEKTMEIAEQIAANGPMAIRGAKKAINSAANSGLELGMEMEARIAANTLASKDFQHGLICAAQRKKPHFTGE